jgi:hypothetical protein
MVKSRVNKFIVKNNFTNNFLYLTSKMHYAGYWALTYYIKKPHLLYNVQIISV